MFAAFSLPEPRAPSAAPARGKSATVAKDGQGRGSGGDTAALDAAMERYALGEDAAFEEIYDGLASRLYGFSLRHTRDRARAEDVVQQTLLQIHRARGRFVPGARVLPWAFAIARRLLIDQHRRSGREVLAKSDDGDDALDLLLALDAAADELAIARQVAARIEHELARLPENQRVAFELIKQEGLSVADAAAALGTTVTAVKLRAHRAYEALRAVLADTKKGEA
jgi:RNA polymerase sigma-70 factor, ECF subfamily